jgi:16S rRNA (cytidine1402-2'-O)-methyltransferase
LKNNKEGKLTIVSLPIGNLKDITIRALEELQSSDLIFCEDTRITIKLLNHYNIKNKLMSYHEHSDTGTRKFIIDQINKGKNISLVSDAGTPLISDPGYKLVKELKKKKLTVTSCPGPSSPITALTLKIKARKDYLLEIKDIESTIIFFESSNRLVKSLELILEIFGDRNISICRELTKKFEEVITLKVSEVIKNLSSRDNIKGEIIIVIEGEVKKDKPQNLEAILEDTLKSMSLSDAAKEISKYTNFSKKEVYNAALDLKGRKNES